MKVMKFGKKSNPLSDDSRTAPSSNKLTGGLMEKSRTGDSENDPPGKKLFHFVCLFCEL
jgi:hypothetical protein